MTFSALLIAVIWLIGACLRVYRMARFYQIEEYMCGRYLRWLFGFGLGFASVGYYPTLALLDRPDPLGLPGWVGWCAPAVSLVTAGVATLAWRAGVRQYRSTGS